MRRVFLFWSFIILILVVGTAATIYSKILLQREQERADKIMEELALSEPSRVPRLPDIASDEEIEEMPTEIEPPEQLPLESLKAAQEIELPESTEAEALPQLPLEAPKMPTLPELPTTIEIEPLGEPE